jgi:hypothetical protein
MFVGDFPQPMVPGDERNLALEFTGDLTLGQTITIVANDLEWAQIDIDEKDPNAVVDPAPQKNGNPTVFTMQDPAVGLRTFVVQNVSGQRSNKYRLGATATLSDGQRLTRYGHIWCRAKTK